MESACLEALENKNSALIMLASVLDFVPSNKLNGKLSSSESLNVDFVKTDKIISKLHPKSGIKVGFKLEAQLPLEKAQTIADSYMSKYNLSFMVLNQLSHVDSNRHQAYLFNKSNQHEKVSGKANIATKIAKHLQGK